MLAHHSCIRACKRATRAAASADVYPIRRESTGIYAQAVRVNWIVGESQDWSRYFSICIGCGLRELVRVHHDWHRNNQSRDVQGHTRYGDDLRIALRCSRRAANRETPRSPYRSDEVRRRHHHARKRACTIQQARKVRGNVEWYSVPVEGRGQAIREKLHLKTSESKRLPIAISYCPA